MELTNMYVDIFIQHKQTLELVPIFILGTCLGASDYFIAKESGLTVALTKILQSGILCALVYGLLTTFEVPYLFRVCTAGLVAFYGVDKALELVNKLISAIKDYKGANNDKTSSKG